MAIKMNKQTTGEQFITYLKNREYNNLQTLFSKDIVFRAVLPSKNPFREATNNSDAVENFKRWYGDADQFDLIKSQVEHLHGTRYFISYEFELHDSDGWQTISQSIYCNIEDGIMTSVSLNCSGFLPLER